jgi:Glycosyl transferase family 2
MQVAVVCSVKDEGPFLVEWVTWYRMLGFARIVVVTNDCTDHSPALLDAMAAAGWLTHLRCTIPPGARIEATKLALARKHKQVFRADWLLVCDVDEFLVVHVGDNRVQDLIAYPEQPVQGIAINWRVFGNSGLSHWQDAPAHRIFCKAALPDHQSTHWFKSLFTNVRAFRRLDSQGPRGFQRDRAGLAATDFAKPWVNTDGEAIPGWDAGVPESRMMPRGSVAQNVAQLNHYMIRSNESFSLKRGTPSASAGVDRYTDHYLATYNRNDTREDSALIYRARFDTLHAAAMALPGVALLHHQCCADYVARLCAKTGIAPQADPRWQAHMAHVTAPA